MPFLLFEGKKLPLSTDKTIFDYADELQVRVPTSCGRSGECHECIVEITQGVEALSPPTQAEHFLRDNYRLACQARSVDPSKDVAFKLLKRRPQILGKGERVSVELDPLTRREGNFVCFEGERLDGYRGRIYGLAVDVGTTTVVLNLLDLETGNWVFTSSFENPQRFGGSDVMHRISYDGGPDHGELQKAMIAAINYEIRDLCRRLGFPRREIYEMVVVGNSTMRDLFFSLDVQSIGQKPYKSVTEHELDGKERTTTSLNLKAEELRLHICPGANVYGAPLIGSHVGSDVAADLLVIGMAQQEEVVMLVDVGTNTEVVVGNKDRLLAASCPAGPAFEGGLVTFGMPGYEGAIESLHLTNGGAQIQTIGNVQPQGICGSGLVDLVAELRRTGRMDELGVFQDGSDKFTVVSQKGITVSRADLSALAQAKAANFCGQWIVLRNYGLLPEQVSRLYLAGGFANYLNVGNAVSIGFIANFPEERITKVGNAAVEGATAMLLSRSKRQMVEDFVRRAEHVELETTPDFFEIFVEGCQFKPMSQSA